MGETNQKGIDVTNEVYQKMVDQRFDAFTLVMNTRFDALDAALKLRTSELDRRLEGLNALRAEVIKDRDQFVQKTVYEYAHRVLENQINVVNEKVNLVINRLTVVETRTVTWTAAIALFFMFIQIVLHFWGLK
jgi:hypothetical protein